MVLGRCEGVAQPDLDINQQPLRRSDLEIVEADVRLNLQALEHDSRRPHLEVRRNEATELGNGRGHRGPRNWTSRSRREKRWPESIVSISPVTAVAPIR